MSAPLTPTELEVELRAERTMTGETLAGIPVAYYVEETEYGGKFANHWSTIPAYQNPVRLFKEADVRALLSDVERLTGELGQAQADMHDAMLVADNYDHRALAAEASLSASQAREAVLKEALEAEKRKLPRLTEEMIRGACRGHYRSDEIDGIDLTYADINYNFRAGFKRMWSGIRATLKAGEAGS